MIAPEIFSEDEYEKNINKNQPIYPLTQGITQKSLRSIIRQAIDITKNQLVEYLPSEIRETYHLAEYNYAISQIHYPDNDESLNEAKKRLVFDEFLLYQLALINLKQERKVTNNNFIIKDIKEIEILISNLPYELTNAQKKVLKDIISDLKSNKVMNRLVQGDVGSGKTIIAALALLLISMNNYQGCLMAPTEVLAKQHYNSLKEIFDNYDIKIGLLVGSMTQKQKKEVYINLKEQKIDILIGTHAVIEDKVEFANLALVITDEQHRFGVKQREKLSNKGNTPHILVMSATPIPRTLALIVYGDLDISIIDEMPQNRQIIKTYAVDTSYRKRIYNFLQKEIKNGRQAYIICPMVDESEELDLESVVNYTEQLKQEIQSNIHVEYLHGKMKANEKNKRMVDFLENKINVLVSTTVVEVGVNVPNATVMIIENAERFGLAQLHQLRGRVGRGKYQSYCILISDSKNNKTNERLDVLCNSNNGFEISEYDLKSRGPGDFFGSRQHGSLEFRLADIFQNANLLLLANEAAKKILNDSNDLEKYQDLKYKLDIFSKFNLDHIPL